MGVVNRLEINHRLSPFPFCPTPETITNIPGLVRVPIVATGQDFTR